MGVVGSGVRMRHLNSLPSPQRLQEGALVFTERGKHPGAEDQWYEGLATGDREDFEIRRCF